MKLRWVFLVGLLMLAGLAATNAPVSQPRDGVFIHVSHGSDDPHRVVMALQMAQIMQEQKDVLLYFDIKGVEVCLKNAQDIQYSQFSPSKTQIQQLLAKKVTIMACPGCLKAAGKTAEDLAPGIQVADKDKFFTFTKGRILTLDY
jgi:predicted peroxiredoxin